jgi:hypothetical protein
MVNTRPTINIVPRHLKLGDGVVHEEYAIHCHCGFYEKVGSHSTRPGRKREAILCAMNHNTRRHGYTYKIRTEGGTL